MNSNRYALLVPCFNAAKYIESFLENISSLNLKFDEVLFYDDASKDNTLEILNSHNCKIIEGKLNKGPAYARNQLAKATFCNWFHFHDVDDFLDHDYLNKVARANLLEINDVILCNVDWLNSERTKTVMKWHYKNSELNKNPIEYTLKNPIGGINGLYRKSTFLKINGFDENLQVWEDSDLHIMLALNGAKFHVIEEVLSFSIRREHSQSFNQSEGWKYRLLCLKKYFALFDNTHYETLGREAEKLLTIFIKNKQSNHLKQALDLIFDCGIKAPNSKIFKKISLILPYKFMWWIRLIHLKIVFN